MRKLQTKHLVLITVNVALWLMNTLALRGTVQLSAFKKTGVELTSDPARVRITINGTPYNGGSYVDTPVMLPIPIGQHKVMVQRAGYHSNTSTIISTSSESIPKINTVLETATENLREVVIDSPQGDALEHLDLSVANGLEVGKLPLHIIDLVAGTHTLEITSGLWSKLIVRCQFEVPVGPATEPLSIKIEAQGKKIRVNGCKKIKN